MERETRVQTAPPDVSLPDVNVELLPRATAASEARSRAAMRLAPAANTASSRLRTRRIAAASGSEAHSRRLADLETLRRALPNASTLGVQPVVQRRVVKKGEENAQQRRKEDNAAKLLQQRFKRRQLQQAFMTGDNAGNLMRAASRTSVCDLQRGSSFRSRRSVVASAVAAISPSSPGRRASSASPDAPGSSRASATWTSPPAPSTAVAATTATAAACSLAATTQESPVCCAAAPRRASSKVRRHEHLGARDSPPTRNARWSGVALSPVQSLESIGPTDWQACDAIVLAVSSEHGEIQRGHGPTEASGVLSARFGRATRRERLSARSPVSLRSSRDEASPAGAAQIDVDVDGSSTSSAKVGQGAGNRMAANSELSSGSSSRQTSSNPPTPIKLGRLRASFRSCANRHPSGRCGGGISDHVASESAPGESDVASRPMLPPRPRLEVAKEAAFARLAKQTQSDPRPGEEYDLLCDLSAFDSFVR